MTILRVGPNKKYSDGWAAAFGGKKPAVKATAKRKSAKRAGKKSRK